MIPAVVLVLVTLAVIVAAFRGREPEPTDDLDCTCGDAFYANQCWHFDDCPRYPLDHPGATR